VLLQQVPRNRNRLGDGKSSGEGTIDLAANWMEGFQRVSE
jgi:hypothetical protein